MPPCLPVRTQAFNEKLAILFGFAVGFRSEAQIKRLPPFEHPLGDDEGIRRARRVVHRPGREEQDYRYDRWPSRRVPNR